jgi:predicted glycosyltransferase
VVRYGVQQGFEMRILVEVTHPAHVHFFRNAIGIWKSHGHEVAVTARDKEIVIELLNLYGIEHIVLSSIGKGKLSLLSELVKRDYKLWQFCRKFKPDILTAIGGVFATHAGFLFRKPVIVWDDTEHAKISHKMTFSFAAAVYTPDCYLINLGKKQVRYAGCHELAYLHPSRFTPDKNVLKNIGIDPDEKYCLVRFVSWQAHHDVGQHGFAENLKVKFVNELNKFAKVYITSESVLPGELEKFRLKIPVHQVHHLMAFASLCVTEGATMASESALLGVPVIYINTLKLGYVNMLEKYGLIKQTTETDEALKLCLDFLKDKDIKNRCSLAQQKFLNEKIDVTQYVVEAIERR